MKTFKTNDEFLAEIARRRRRPATRPDPAKPTPG